MKQIYYFVCLLSFLAYSSTGYSQRGKNGPLTVSSTIEVNEYTTLTANAVAGSTSITVAGSSLNGHGRFSSNLSEGDLIMLIQMQGATLLSGVEDSTWGAITNYNNCGLYELCEVLKVPNSTTIKLSCPLTNSYTSSGNVQVVRIPRYSTLTVNGGGVINCDAWNGSTGGIVAVEVLGTTSINGNISADSLGFRGGAILDNSGSTNSIGYDSTSVALGGQKGEGIGGYQTQYNIYGGMYGRGAPGNGGGGGDQWNASGGGGGNGGNINLYNGNGNPDTTTSSWDSAWNLEYAGFDTNVSSGGGRGGYTISWFPVGTPNPLTTPPGNSDWGMTDRNRMNAGGKGGRPLDYTTGRLFLGGGGGAGHEDQSLGGPGGNGGGIIYISAYGAVLGSGSVHSNGGAGGNDNSNNTLGDGMGGGGSGGTIIIANATSISGISVKANGGRGGYQYITSSYENEGPGGGGGGGHIELTQIGVSTSVAGGANGLTDSPYMTKFPPNGATKGGAGDVDTLSSFTISARNDTVCSGSTATLTASLSANAPPGITIEWYDSAKGGTIVGTGSTYTTFVLTRTTIFYVTTCPGDYRVPDTAFVKTINLSLAVSNDSICNGDTAILTAGGANSYHWSTNQSTSSIKVAPVVTTTYSLSVTNQGCAYDTSVTVNVLPPLTSTISAAPDTICPPSASILMVTATGGQVTYKWNNGGTHDTINVKPAVTTTYTVSVYGKCDTLIKTITVHVVPPVHPVINSLSDSICKGDSVWLVGKGGTTYLWSNHKTNDSIKVAPLANTTYTLTAYNGICSNDTTFTMYVRPLVTANINVAPDTVCPMSISTINITALGGQATYKWSTGATTSSIRVIDSVTRKYIATVYGVCDSVKDTVTITVIPLDKLVIKGKLSRCLGSRDTLTVSGGGSYIWSNGSTKNTYITGSINADSTITVVALNSLGCPDSASYKIKMLPPPGVTLADTNTCLDNPVTIYALSSDSTSQLSYAWAPGGETGESITVPDTGQSYTVTVSNGCISRQSIKLSPAIISMSACCDNLILQGDDTIITAHGLSPGEITSYKWSPSVTCLNPICDSVKVSPQTTTTYTVIGTDSLGCQTESVVTIVVDAVCFNFAVPNVFTPTEAGLLGLNNVFYIKTENMSAWSIDIYDRWGNEVFKSTNPAQYWDGKTESGGDAAAGVYYYLIKGTCQNNTYNKEGFVQLIR